MNRTYRLVWNQTLEHWVAVAEIARARGKRAAGAVLLLAAASGVLSAPSFAQTPPAPDQLPVGGQVVAGQAGIAQGAAAMTITQTTARAVIDWQTFNVGSAASVHFQQPSASAVTLNRVLDSNPSQIFGRITAPGQVILSNPGGAYFSPSASVDVGSLMVTTHAIGNEDFMAGQMRFTREGATGSVVNEGSLTAALGGYIALLAPEVRNEGIIVAQMGTVALAAGEAYTLQFAGNNTLADIQVEPATIAALVENAHAVQAPGGLIILSAQAANRLQGGVVKNSGSLEATGLVDDGGVIRLAASDGISHTGTIRVDAAAGKAGKGGSAILIASLENRDSVTEFDGFISARGGDAGGDGGFVETSASHLTLGEAARVDTRAVLGDTGLWLIDPYDYVIDAGVAATLVTNLAMTDVTVTTLADVPAYGSDGDSNGSGTITVNSAIVSGASNKLTLDAADSITVNAAISVGALELIGPNGIALGANLTTRTDMTLNGDVTLLSDVTLTSGITNTYSAYTVYTVPNDVTAVTAIMIGGAGGRGGNDGGNQGGGVGTVGKLIASFAVTPGDLLYLAPGGGGAQGPDSQANVIGGVGGTNQFGLAGGGIGGRSGPNGFSGSGGGGGAASVLSLTAGPTTASALLMAGGGGGGGGSGNNSACPSLCAGQSGTNYRTDGSLDGQAGKHAGNQPAGSIDDGGGSGGGGGGLAGGLTNDTVFFVNEWTGRGGNSGSSGAANGFTTTSLSVSQAVRTASQGGSITIGYGGGTIAINGSVDGARNLVIDSPIGNVAISGAVGAGTPLTSLDVTGATGISLGSSVTTTGAQTYTGNLTLDAATTSLNTGNGAVTFGGDVLKGSGAGNLSVNTGSGDVLAYGTLGSSLTPLGAIAIGTTGTTTLGGAVYGASLSKTGAGKTVIGGGLVQTSGAQHYGGGIELSGNTQLASTGAGDIGIVGAVSNNTQSDLSISAANGNVSLLGNLAVGTNIYGPTPIGAVSITASGSVTMGSAGTPISVDARSLSVTADSMTLHAASTGFTCRGNVSAVGICSATSFMFDVVNDSSVNGALSGPASLTKNGAGTLSLFGANTYSGNTTINDGAVEIRGNGSLGNGNYSGNIDVATKLKYFSTANQTLTGTMSGAGFINGYSSGVINITPLGNARSYNTLPLYVLPAPADNGATSSVYGSGPASFVYSLALAADGSSAVTDANPQGTAVYTNGLTTTGVGSYTVTYSSGLYSLENAYERYSMVPGNGLTWTVTPRPLDIAVSKTYDGNAVFSGGFLLTGMVNGDAAPTVSSGSAAVASANAGAYNSFASNTLVSSNGNYTLVGGTVDASIDKAPLTVTADNQARLYGQANPVLSQTITGFVNGETAATAGVTGAALGSTAATVSTGAGSYAIISSTGSLAADNYSFSAGGNGTLTVNKAHLTVTADDQIRLFGEANPDFTQTISGFVNGETLGTSGVVGILAYGGSTATTTTAVGQYVITASAAGLSASNYDFITADGTLTITALPPVLLQAPVSPVVVAPVEPPTISEPPATDTAGGLPATGGGANAVSGAVDPTGNVNTAHISVTLVRAPSTGAAGEVVVAVPKAITSIGSGFSFALPDQLAGEPDAPIVVTTGTGATLPAWLKFDPQTRVFTASFIPDKGLPITLIITVGAMTTSIVITEQEDQ